MMKPAKQKRLLWLATALLLVAFLPVARSTADEQLAESAVNRLLQAQFASLPFTPTTDHVLVVMRPLAGGAQMGGDLIYQAIGDAKRRASNGLSAQEFMVEIGAYWREANGQARSVSAVGRYEIAGHGGENDLGSDAGGGISMKDHPGDTSRTEQAKNSALKIETENVLIMGTYNGSLSISPSVGQCTLYGVRIAGDLQVSPGTRLTVGGGCTVGTLNGAAGPGEQQLNVVLEGSLSPVTDSGKNYCVKCLRAGVTLQKMACGKHYVCLADRNADAEVMSHQTFAQCGEHYKCQMYDNPSLHTEKGKACEQYLCHKPNAEYHTRCKRCGGPLCSDARHGDGVCYHFKVKYDAPVQPSDSNPDVNPDEIPQ